ncbi:MAG: 4-hydroxy-3-methylbut-2-enyl diphosphate reductase [Candidatus Cloacimonetes bacterium]|nr:4-hydroxy-3-methylbut-2-enyl diphosphate reductase [Candidatus Cloacimonadota bacterium]
MNIRLAKNSGFCFGVKRAIKLAEETAQNYGQAITIGPIIHNPQMVQQLANVGIKAIDDIDSILQGPVIIRSHGIPQESLQKLIEKQFQIIDATCPDVAKAHKFAKLADKENYKIFIVGDPWHPEIVALKSYIKSEAVIWRDGEQLPDKFYGKAAIICQTTQNSHSLEKLTGYLLPKCKELRIFNTICNTTHVRQEASLDLAKVSDIMIVIGGKNSANTLMLTKLCSEYTTTKHIETVDEIDYNWFYTEKDKKIENIGITAGASTPDGIIADIYNKIKVTVGEADSLVKTINDIPGYKEEPHEFRDSKRKQ